MATIKDVAREAGVSIATVSRVINQSPQAGKASIASVQAAMKKLHYRPNANARALVSKNTNTIGVLVSDVSDPFFGSLLKGVDQVARQNNMHLLIGNGYHNPQTEREAIDILINSRSKSLIIHSKGLSDQELIDFATEVPGMVLINRFIPELADRCIAFDNYNAAYMATEYLIKHGHKEIAYINSDHKISDANDRKAGYLKALQDNHLSCSDDYTLDAHLSDTCGYTAMTELLAKNLPITAVLAYNDYMAAGALMALNEHNIAVPEKISLIGFDNGLIARYIHPQLTTINYPIKLMGIQATELSLKLAKNQKFESASNMFAPTLVQRLSVANKN
ncbi:substrate-binding domain-containing protein [Psychromonas sp. MME2]|uniref:substrate-binding domain-containing protein n=1 Tax=Psychromonas sp. MME2 TaxID=3231033 RepID=UPI00339C759A